MLNISPHNTVDGKIDLSKYKSFSGIETKTFHRKFRRILTVIFMLLLLLMFMPWTQNIRARGGVTALTLGLRPQSIQSVIAGRIERWYVKEGQYVEKGDTILYITEIKDEYFDPNLLKRTEEQIKSKEGSVGSYMEKVKAIDNQINALMTTRDLKYSQAQNYLKQAQLKLKSDSIDYEAAKVNYSIAERQFKGIEKLYEAGTKTLTEYEGRKLKLQEAQAKIISAENKVLATRNELLNAKIELSTITAEYSDKLSKAESEKYSSLSNMYDAEATVTKMQNQYINYSMRIGYYYITAPQSGYITKAIKQGIGQNVKEGEELITVMPAKYDYAVELYINPVDLPLVDTGNHVRLIFDGWPSIVFSGWPNVSCGTYGGIVKAIDNFTSENGKYRILVAPDPNDKQWPKELRMGSGALGMALLKEVPVWYELWRQINGFPPEYYIKGETNTNKDKK